MTVTVYQSSDVSAPVIEPTTAGSLVAALRACLVNGYGSKTAAGWTEPYTGTNTAAFRNSTASGGTGCYVLVTDTATTGVRQASFVTYESMSNISTGTYPTATAYGARFPRNGGSTADALTWTLIADEYTFYFIGHTLTTLTTQFLVGAGDTDSFQTVDAFRYFTLGDPEFSFYTPPTVFNCNSYANNILGSTAPSATGLSLGRDRTGTSASGGSPHALLLPRTGVSAYAGSSNLMSRPPPNGMTEPALPAYFGRTDCLRGKLRGAYIPLTNLSALTPGASVSTADFGGVGSQCAPMVCGGNDATYIGGLWIETALGW